MLGTYAENIYLIERLDHYRDSAVLYGKHLPKLLFLIYCGTFFLPVCVRSTITNLYAALMALLMFAEVMPFVGWKVAVHTKKKILLQQNSFMLFVYSMVVCALSFINTAKGIVFFIFILSQNLNSPFLSTFLTTSLSGNDAFKNARREGAFTLLSETILILMVIITIQKYRPIVIGAKDAIYYRRQMVHFVH